MIEIHNIHFKYKKDIEKYVRDILYNNIQYGKINNIDEFNFMNELFKRHPDKEQKIGCGIKDILLGKNKLNAKGIHIDIIRNDNTKVDISWLLCISSNTKTDKQNLNSAFRSAIKDSIFNFKHDNIKKCGRRCNHCKKLTLENDLDVDHFNIEFKDLVQDFSNKNLLIPNSFMENKTYHYNEFKIDDNIFKKNWIEYHNRYCTLQLLCKKCHANKTYKK